MVEVIEGADDTAITRWLHRRLVAALAANEAPVAITVPGGWSQAASDHSTHQILRGVPRQVVLATGHG